MQNETTALKIDCVNIVNKMNSHDVISDASELYKYLSNGDISVKIECVYMLIENENRPTSLEILIKELDDVYNFVINL